MPRIRTTQQKEALRLYQRERYRKLKESKSEMYQRTLEKGRKRIHKYMIDHPDKFKKTKLDSQRKRRQDVSYRFKQNIRNRIKYSVTGKYSKKSKSFDILGCNAEFFRNYIESRWESWMTWENYGNWDGYPKSPNKSWDLDHIIPTSSALTEEETLKLNHYTNFQPLCSYVNRCVKRDNVTPLQDVEI